MNKLKLFSLSTFFLMFFTMFSGAVVLIEDVETGSEVSLNPFNSATVPTGVGETGNYVLLACSTTAEGANIFLDPAPGGWTLLHQGVCPTGACIQGIWGRFVDTAESEDITCGWTENRFAFTGGTFRYSGVDTDNPIINIGCAVRTSDPAVAPSIFTETQSQVARFVTSTLVENGDEPVDIEQNEFSGFNTNATGGDGINIKNTRALEAGL
jgi:hypothetical protein